VTRPRRRRGEAGFSFIEVVIASLLLLMIAVAVLPMFTEAAASNEVGKEYTDVANYARSRAEEFTQLGFNAEPLTITAGTSRVHDETYLAIAKKWITGTTVPAGDRPVWYRKTTIKQYEATDPGLTTPLPAGTDALRIQVKEILVEVHGASVGSLFGPMKTITVRTLKTS
jgi:type II secretory pathway pseudopilin PulG